MCERVGKLIQGAVVDKGHQVTLFDPMTIDLPMLQKPLHWHGPNEDKPDVLVDTHVYGLIIFPTHNFLPQMSIKSLPVIIYFRLTNINPTHKPNYVNRMHLYLLRQSTILVYHQR